MYIELDANNDSALCKIALESLIGPKHDVLYEIDMFGEAPYPNQAPTNKLPSIDEMDDIDCIVIYGPLFNQNTFDILAEKHLEGIRQSFCIKYANDEEIHFTAIKKHFDIGFGLLDDYYDAATPGYRLILSDIEVVECGR